MFDDILLSAVLVCLIGSIFIGYTVRLAILDANKTSELMTLELKKLVILNSDLDRKVEVDRRAIFNRFAELEKSVDDLVQRTRSRPRPSS
jgi:hypothetical protein